MSNQEQGLYRKFYVWRADGRDQPGGDRHGAEYFALDLTHDKFAPAAMAAYALDCQEEYPALARDLIERHGLATGQLKPMVVAEAVRDACTELFKRRWASAGYGSPKTRKHITEAMQAIDLVTIIASLTDRKYVAGNGQGVAQDSRHATAIQQDAVMPDKWQLAPMVPTEEMLLAGQDAWLKDPTRRSSTLYRAMLAAAPKPPAPASQAQTATTASRDWKLTFDDGGHEHPAVRRDDGKLIADVYGYENGRRIIACMNACEGISTEDLERYYNNGAGIDEALEETGLQDHIKAVQERGQLLAALETLVFEYEGYFEGAPESTAQNAARSAIAAVKGCAT